MKKVAARQVWDDEQIARAVGYTTSRFQGRGVFDTRTFDLLKDALADARGDRRAIVYAITPEGWTIHITNGDEIADQETTAMTTETIITDAADQAADRDRKVADLLAPEDAPISNEPAKPRKPRGKKADQPAADAPAADPAPKGRKGRKAADQPAADAPVEQPEPAAKADKPKKLSARAQLAADTLAAAEAGKLPPVPNFDAPTHNSYRKKLMGLVDAAKAGNLAHLEADTTEPKCSSRIPLCRYRDLAIIAVKAQLAKKAAKEAKAAS